MGFGFLRKKAETISVEEAEVKVRILMEESEKSFRAFMNEKCNELNEEIKNLLNMLQEFDYKNIHPRLRNQARNFVSAMINLWKDVPRMSDEKIILELPKRMEKVAFMKIKHFRMLFALNPPEIEQIEISLKRIVELMDEIETRKKELKLENLSEVMSLIERLKQLNDEKNRIEIEEKEITSQILNLESSQNNKKDTRIDELIAKLNEEKEVIANELRKRESELYRKIAYTRKPLKIYAHMVGTKVKLEGDGFLNNLDEISSLASGAIQEIRKGNIKLKEKNLENVVNSLDEIARGKLKDGLEEVKKLRKQLREVENKLKKIPVIEKKNNVDELRKKLLIMSEMGRKTENEISEIKRSLEKKLSEILDKTVRISE